MNKCSKQIVEELNKVQNQERAKVNAWFFKDYEYLGRKNSKDHFLGVKVPETRKVVKSFLKNNKDLKIETFTKIIQNLLDDKYHEIRLAGAILLRQIYVLANKNNDKSLLKNLFELYNTNIGWNKGINNWDLVDEAAREIAGHYVCEIMEHDERFKWINESMESKDLWVNRVVVVATWWEIKKRNEKMCFYVVKRLLGHKHDLIHKACGWMLREVGKNCGKNVLSKFIHENIKQMPRTCLRYAIEHFPQEERKLFLKL